MLKNILPIPLHFNHALNVYKRKLFKLVLKNSPKCAVSTSGGI